MQSRRTHNHHRAGHFAARPVQHAPARARDKRPSLRQKPHARTALQCQHPVAAVLPEHRRRYRRRRSADCYVNIVCQNYRVLIQCQSAVFFAHLQTRSRSRHRRRQRRHFNFNKNRGRHRGDVCNQSVAAQTRARDALAVFAPYRVKEMRARVKTSRPRRRCLRLVDCVRVGYVAADVAAAAVVFNSEFNAAARLKVQTPARAAVVAAAFFAAKVVITGAQLNPFALRHAKDNVGVKTRTRVNITIARAFGVGDGEVSVRADVAQPRAQLSAQRPPPKAAVVAAFVIQKYVRAAECFFVQHAAVKRAGVQTLRAFLRAKRAQLPADNFIVALAQRPRRINANLALALAQRRAKSHARAAHKRKTILRPRRQRLRQCRFRVLIQRQRRAAKLLNQSRAAYFAPLAHVNVFAVAVADEHVPEFGLRGNNPQQRPPRAVFGFFQHLRRNINPKTPRAFAVVVAAAAAVIVAAVAVTVTAAARQRGGGIRLFVFNPIGIQKPRAVPGNVRRRHPANVPLAPGNIPLRAQRHQQNQHNPRRHPKPQRAQNPPPPLRRICGEFRRDF